jgi:basic amino acid/polyamine antiporter, APA family
MKSKKMGFWSATSLVAGSQIGTGIFLLPASMAILGSVGLCSWLITATGGILLALIFARLCAHHPKTGGPHIFIEQAFGKHFGFFAAWTYWVISWLSTPVVVLSIVNYLSPFLGPLSPFSHLILQLGILSLMTGLNLLGARSAGKAEFIFTLLKLLPLVLVPIASLFFLNPSHFLPFNPTSHSLFGALNAGALLTLWGFVGVESATTPAESVENPQKTLPRAIITGTLIVAGVYILSSLAIMGVVPPETLKQSSAPFADASQSIFGGNWSLVISLATSIVCLGTLNAWVLTSGQIALGAAQSGYFPRFFISKNRHGAPKWGLILSSLGMVPVLLLTLQQDRMTQINSIIDVSVTAFLFIYTLSTLSYLRLFWKKEQKKKTATLILGIASLTFCSWALYASGIKMVALAMCIPLSGLPLYLWKKREASPVYTNELNNL